MMMMIKIIVIIIIIILLFLFRALLDQVTVVEDNPSVRSTCLQPSASIKERSKVHWSENVTSEIIFYSFPVDALVFFQSYICVVSVELINTWPEFALTQMTFYLVNFCTLAILKKIWGLK